jgi:hypothetical protein
MVAETPTVVPAIQAVIGYEQQHQSSLASEHREILLEIKRRLERLEVQAGELIDINNRMWAKQEFNLAFDSATDTITVSVGGMQQSLTLKRADPNVPLQIRELTAGTGYHAGTSEAADEEEQRLRVELEQKLESYYQSAHRVLKLFGRVPGLAQIRCVAVSRVRNELIEHPSDGTLYSFGVGSTGPRVKPMYQGTPKFNDEGLLPNTNAFVQAIVVGCGAGAH